jgi:hypothetical protein
MLDPFLYLYILPNTTKVAINTNNKVGQQNRYNLFTIRKLSPLIWGKLFILLLLFIPTQASYSPTISPNYNYFIPNNCEGVLVPSEYRNMSIVCEYSNFSSIELNNGIIVGINVTIIIDDFLEEDLTSEEEGIISFVPYISFIPFSETGISLLNAGANLSCVWFDLNQQPQTSGTYLISNSNLDLELNSSPSLNIVQELNLTPGRYCSSTHLGTVTLVIYQSNSGQPNTEIFQYFGFIVSAILFIVATIFTIKGFHILKTFTTVLAIHLAVTIAALIMCIIYLIAEAIGSPPLALLISLVTSIEITCYISLIYIWAAPFGGDGLNISYTPSWTLVLSLIIIILINIGCTVITLFYTPSNIDLNAVRDYCMAAIILILCCVLNCYGYRLRKKLLVVNIHSRTRSIVPLGCGTIFKRKLFHLPNKILIGSICLNISMIGHACYWVLLHVFDCTNRLELSFGAPALITYVTMLYLFHTGISEVTNNRPTKTSKSKSKSKSKSSKGISIIQIGAEPSLTPRAKRNFPEQEERKSTSLKLKVRSNSMDASTPRRRPTGEILTDSQSSLDVPRAGSTRFNFPQPSSSCVLEHKSSHPDNLPTPKHNSSLENNNPPTPEHRIVRFNSNSSQLKSGSNNLPTPEHRTIRFNSAPENNSLLTPEHKSQESTGLCTLEHKSTPSRRESRFSRVYNFNSTIALPPPLPHSESAGRLSGRDSLAGDRVIVENGFVKPYTVVVSLSEHSSDN